MSLSEWNETADSATSFELYALGTYSDVNGGAERNTAAAADAIFYVKLSDMRSVFQFQRGTGTTDVSLNDAIFDASSDIRYYVFRKYWPTALNLNPSHAMLDRNESSGMLTPGAGAGAYSADKSLVKHDFLRYIALNLFNTIHGVDLFRNEDDLRENLAYYGEVARVGIMSVLDTVGTMSANSVMAADGSGNRYSTNEDTTVTNISRELMRQIAVSAPGRLGAIDASGGDVGVIQSVPLSENDTLNFKVVMAASPGQNALTNVAAIPARTYNIKLIMKSVVGVGGDGGGTYTNTSVSDSALFPNGYPYAVNVYDISASNASVAPSVYANGSPPVPIPLIRYGYQGWYYTNSDAWVNTAPSVRNKINWYILPNSATTTVGDLRYIRLNLHVFSRVSTPFLTVYTQTTGVDDSGGWYKSKRVYVVANAEAAALSNNTNYCFYMNWNGYSVAPFTVAHTNVALSLTTVEGGAVGAFGSGEVLFAYSIGTDSGAARGNVEFILSGAVVGEGGGGGGSVVVTEKEYGYIPL
jgi:hypothetical protein